MWVEQDHDGFVEMLRAYDAHVAEQDVFAYGDTVADFYLRIWRTCPDLEVRSLLMAGLIRTGWDLNRFYVGDVVCDLLVSLSSPADVAVAVEAIDANPRAAAWYADNTLRRPLRAPIAEALRRADDHAAASGS